MLYKLSCTIWEFTFVCQSPSLGITHFVFIWQKIVLRTERAPLRKTTLSLIGNRKWHLQFKDLLPGSLFEEHWFLRCEVFCLVAPGPVRAVGRGPCWPLQCLMCRLSALSSAGLEPAVSVFVSASAQPSAGAAASDSKGNTQYHCGLNDIFVFLALKLDCHFYRHNSFSGLYYFTITNTKTFV